MMELMTDCVVQRDDTAYRCPGFGSPTSRRENTREDYTTWMIWMTRPIYWRQYLKFRGDETGIPDGCADVKRLDLAMASLSAND